MSEEKKFCTNCGSEVKPNAKFCPSCGQAVETEEAGNTKQKGNSRNFSVLVPVLILVGLILGGIGAYFLFFAGNPLEGEWVGELEDEGIDFLVQIDEENRQTLEMEEEFEGIRIYFDHQLEELDNDEYEIGKFISAAVEVDLPDGEVMPTESEVELLIGDDENVKYDLSNDRVRFDFSDNSGYMYEEFATEFEEVFDALIIEYDNDDDVMIWNDGTGEMDLEFQRR